MEETCFSVYGESGHVCICSYQQQFDRDVTEVASYVSEVIRSFADASLTSSILERSGLDGVEYSERFCKSEIQTSMTDRENANVRVCVCPVESLHLPLMRAYRLLSLSLTVDC